jgi:hypothetical protein
MLKEPRNRELTREDVYAEYYSRLANQEGRSVDDTFAKKMSEVNEYFKGKTQLELMIRGTVYFDKDYKKLFTFLNKTYNIERGNGDELVNCLRDLDRFKEFMNGENINFFSEIENEYVNYTRVLNARIYMELN